MVTTSTVEAPSLVSEIKPKHRVRTTTPVSDTRHLRVSESSFSGTRWSESRVVTGPSTGTVYVVEVYCTDVASPNRDRNTLSFVGEGSRPSFKVPGESTS